MNNEQINYYKEHDLNLPLSSKIHSVKYDIYTSVEYFDKQYFDKEKKVPYDLFEHKKKIFRDYEEILNSKDESKSKYIQEIDELTELIEEFKSYINTNQSNEHLEDIKKHYEELKNENLTKEQKSDLNSKFLIETCNYHQPQVFKDLHY